VTTARSCSANGIELCFETFGDAEDPALLLVMGLGAQMISWDEDFCAALVDRGFHVIRFDNRDVGLSTKVEPQPGADGPPYTLSDMAADAIGLLDHLGIDAAHVVGASMGGMIAQTIAIEHPSRVLTLTSIMSTTGEPEVGQATPEAAARLIAPPATTRDEAIQRAIDSAKVTGGPDFFDEDRLRRKAAAAYDRSFHPVGAVRQVMAIMASGSRAEGLAALAMPTLVIHGDVDTLVTPSGGHRTAELVPGAELLVIEGMGHELPPPVWPQVVEAITANALRAAP
jgi:pimeloyl-ACP methyl ester carboxylesterase